MDFGVSFRKIQQGSGGKIILLLTHTETLSFWGGHTLAGVKTGCLSVPAVGVTVKVSFLSLRAVQTQVFWLGTALPINY